MNLPRLALRALFGRRLPIAAGELRVRGVGAAVTIRRDRWGVPHVEAGSEADAWFGLGFCHGQDRAGQLEVTHRLARGLLAEVLGPAGLPIDRAVRLIGVHRAAQAQLPTLDADTRDQLAAYTAGINAALECPQLPR